MTRGIEHVEVNWGFIGAMAFCFGFWAEVFYWFETGRFIPSW